ncbi:MAG: deoxyribose-phosphate aldolase [Rhizobacter sp.]|nr:deoxyribose-phosphate aldolase [Rhizobacter sp.]
MKTSQDLHATARTALACLDLTSLNDADTEADVARLCQRAQGPHGPVAAVCVWPRLAGFARRELPAQIAVAAVANFPDGSADIERALRDTAQIVDSGAQEVDLVLPYARLMAGDERSVTALLSAVRKACPGLALKVILETGVLADAALIARASVLALAHGADFLKTSTGKTPVSATTDAARVMLGAIAADARAATRVGFKASGGIRSVADAAVYIALCGELLGPQAVSPQRLRIGASSLLDDIEAVLGRPGAAPAPRAGH